jgi:hypothetical protein
MFGEGIFGNLRKCEDNITRQMDGAGLESCSIACPNTNSVEDQLVSVSCSSKRLEFRGALFNSWQILNAFRPIYCTSDLYTSLVC